MTDIVDAYLTAALWTTDPDPGSGEYQADRDSIPEDVRDAARDAVAAFLSLVPEADEEDPSRVGQDLWLTRNRHGAGFWDGDWPEPFASRATKAAQSLGEEYEFELAVWGED